MDPDAFERMVEEGGFLEHARVFDRYYGTSEQAVRAPLEAGEDLVLEIDWQGAQQVRHRFPHADEDWWIEVGDGISPPTTVIPAMVSGGRVPSLRAAPRSLRRLWEN